MWAATQDRHDRNCLHRCKHIFTNDSSTLSEIYWNAIPLYSDDCSLVYHINFPGYYVSHRHSDLSFNTAWPNRRKTSLFISPTDWYGTYDSHKFCLYVVSWFSCHGRNGSVCFFLLVAALAVLCSWQCWLRHPHHYFSKLFARGKPNASFSEGWSDIGIWEPRAHQEI